MTALFLSALTFGAIHALAPDHWMPFVMIGKAKRWPLPRVLMMTFFAGLAHLASAWILTWILISGAEFFPVILGFERSRAHASFLATLAFGAAYLIWALKRHFETEFSPRGLNSEKNGFAGYWILFAIMFFGPCEPLMPLVVLAINQGNGALLGVLGFFSAATLSVMLAQTAMVYQGVSLAERKVFHKPLTEVFAAYGILASALIVKVLGV